jgi:hypothetical protein
LFKHNEHINRPSDKRSDIRKMSGAPTTPGRRRREREEPYIPFNHDPKNFGT